ncbi:hypothetical protein HCN44_008665 [Aphidius gifuensis]|uniref:Uncharacterized protein n=1 Tax=Aphidius gifuensis TaxID=684658 RepID=A0A834XPZ0_APHGI|nr:hypothetical protein HCN44_008665 [Aphidius gifuensis]
MTNLIEFSSTPNQWKFKKTLWWSKFLIAIVIITSTKICESSATTLSNNCVQDSDCGKNTYCNSSVCSCKQGFMSHDRFQCQPNYFDYFLLLTNLDETYTTSYVNLTNAHKNTSKNKIQSSLNLLNASNYNDKYTINIAHTIDCHHNYIYFLRESSTTDDYTKVLDLIHYDNNKYKKISRIFDAFDNATSIAYDWTTNNLYWAEIIDGKHVINKNTKTIIISDRKELYIGKLNVYSKLGIIFWIGTTDIWYAYTASNSSANIFFKTKSQDDLVNDLTIDLPLDRLCWISYNQISGGSSIYFTDINNWQPSKPLKIKTIAENLNGAHGLAVFNNVFYWISTSKSNDKNIYVKNGEKNTIALKLKIHSQELTIVPSHCLISNSKYNDNNLLYLTDNELFEFTKNKKQISQLKIQGMKSKGYNIAINYNCVNKNIYILRKNKKNDDKRTLDVITYANYNFKVIDQIIDTFDYAESMAYDWMTHKTYFVELRNERWAIKVTGPDYKYSEYIAYPEEEPSIGHVVIHPGTRQIFWEASDKIWYVPVDEKTHGERFVFYEGPETINIKDFTIDLALDRLCWFSRQTEILDRKNPTILYCVNVYGPRKIIKIDKNLNDARHLAAHNDTYYWISKNNEKKKSMFFKDGKKDAIKLLSNDIYSGKELIFLLSNCPSSQVSNLTEKI